tara:strand:+ start:900 stop:2153 length:1254 start_codon:yes stop_codon:yes gene_type:complete
MTLHNTILLKELDSRSLAITKDHETLSMNMPKMDRSEPEENANVSCYAILGFPRLKLSILEVVFQDSRYLTVDKNYAGSEWLWNQLGGGNRLKLGIYNYEDKFYVEFKTPKPKLNSNIEQFSTLYTWQKINAENIDEELSFGDVQEFLNAHNIKIGKKSEVLSTHKGRDSEILYWNRDDDSKPGLIYFLLCIFPLLTSSVNFSQPEIVVVDQPVVTRETFFYNLDDLLSSGERDLIECKSSAFFSYKFSSHPTRLNSEIIRSIVGMLNARGGTLLVGVGEDKKTKEYIKYGIKKDFQWMEEADPDPRFEKRMGELTGTWEDYQKVIRKEVMDKIGRTFFNECIFISWEDIGEGKNNPVARIDILPAKTPVSDEKGLRHIRFSNGTQLLPANQEIEYFKNRFPNLNIFERDVNKKNGN